MAKKKRKSSKKKKSESTKLNKSTVGVFKNPPKGSGMFDW